MVGNGYARISSGRPSAYFVVLLLFLLPILGWGQTCPSFSTNYSIASASVTGTQGVPNDGVSYVRNGNLTINAGSHLVVTGTLEITGDLTLMSNFSDVVVCQTGKLIVRGNVILNSKTTITVQGQVDPANPSDYIGGLLIVVGSVTAANNGNIDLNNGGNVVIAGGASSANFINSSSGDTYINPMPGGNSSSLQTFDQLINDPVFQEYAKYSCTTAAADITLSVSPSYSIAAGASATITASTSGAYSTYAFYIGNSTTPAQSGVSKVFTTNALQDGDVVKVYGLDGSCLKSATSLAFTVSTPPSKPSTPTGTTPICQGTATSTVQTTATSGASTYTWGIVQQSGTISPGSISGTGTSAAITWNPSFSGVALVIVTGINGSGTSGPVSDALGITVNQQPAPVLGNTGICAGGSIVLGVTGSYSSYLWNVSTSGFSLSSTASATPTLTAPSNDTLFPVSSTDLVAYPDVSVTVTDGNGCSNSATNNSTDKQVSVFRIPRTGSPYHISNNVAK